jgi:predicted ATPase
LDNLDRYELKHRLIEFFKRAKKAKYHNSTKGIFTRDIANKNTTYMNMSVKVSFGQRFSAKIPWMTFLIEPFTTSNGVYPYIGADVDNNKIISYIGYSRYNKAPVTEEVNNLISEINKKSFEKRIDNFDEIDINDIENLLNFLDYLIEEFNKIKFKFKKAQDFDSKLDIFDNLPKNARLAILTGQNGTGKTRLLEKFSKSVLNKLKDGSSEYTSMICLSGTVLDKFPRENNIEKYIYLGKRVSNNMFSEIAPFRTLFSFLLRDMSIKDVNRIDMAKSLLSRLGFDAVFNLILKPLNKDKTKKEDKINLEIKLDIDSLCNNTNYFNNFTHEGIIISEIQFQKNNKKFELMDLSSGERSYILTLLSLIFMSKDNSIIIYDEPENSLHPQWQIDVIKDIWNITSKIVSNCKVVIATHSPLIISGVVNTNSFILNLEKDYHWIVSSLHGNTSDTILQKQFGVISPRSVNVLKKIQNCLKLAVTIEKNPVEFKTAAASLLDLKLNIDQDDSLYLTIKEIERLFEKVS